MGGSHKIRVNGTDMFVLRASSAACGGFPSGARFAGRPPERSRSAPPTKATRYQAYRPASPENAEAGAIIVSGCVGAGAPVAGPVEGGGMPGMPPNWFEGNAGAACGG